MEDTKSSFSEFDNEGDGFIIDERTINTSINTESEISNIKSSESLESSDLSSSDLVVLNLETASTTDNSTTIVQESTNKSIDEPEFTPKESSKSSNSVRVAVRIRPIHVITTTNNSKTIDQDEIITANSSNSLIIHGSNISSASLSSNSSVAAADGVWDFDQVYDGDSTQVCRTRRALYRQTLKAN
jgi:hypothetical protein